MTVCEEIQQMRDSLMAFNRRPIEFDWGRIGDILLTGGEWLNVHGMETSTVPGATTYEIFRGIILSISVPEATEDTSGFSDDESFGHRQVTITVFQGEGSSRISSNIVNDWVTLEACRLIEFGFAEAMRIEQIMQMVHIKFGAENVTEYIRWDVWNDNVYE